MKTMLWLIRHGETEWSLSGAHTGRTDIPLTARGEQDAEWMGKRFGQKTFSLVLTSPLERARRTCELAGFGAQAQIDPNLAEWDYGSYEGLTTQEIRKTNPGWLLFKDGVPDGETVEQVGARAQAVIERALSTDGDALLFAHGHILRVLTACWLNLSPDAGSLFVLGTASLSLLGYERETRVISQWNTQ